MTDDATQPLPAPMSAADRALRHETRGVLALGALIVIIMFTLLIYAWTMSTVVLAVGTLLALGVLAAGVTTAVADERRYRRQETSQ